MRLFSTEAVSKYHPDKYADQISDTILTECLRQDKSSHCGIETLVKNDTVVLAGEVTTSAMLDYSSIVESVARKLGYCAMCIWYSEDGKKIGIDCGSGYPTRNKRNSDIPMITRLACLRLDDMKEFYSEEPEEGEDNG